MERKTPKKVDRKRFVRYKEVAEIYASFLQSTARNRKYSKGTAKSVFCLLHNIQ